MAKVFDELKRRNVFRVGGAYLVVGWITLQVVDIVQPALGLPEWINSAIIYLLLAGLPVTLILAWVFEITPQGILRDEEARACPAQPRGAGRRTDFAIIALLAVALTYFVWDKYLAPTAPDAQFAASEASIAVLPFADLSPNSDQEYFADGISEEILNVLARVPNLRVAARTSSFQFRKQNLDIPAIARRLNVNNVLEGSVRKAGTRVRITAQLIDAKTGFHLWSDTYDRELLDILALQDEIAAAIVGELKQRLSVNWNGAMPEMPMREAMTDSAAYDEYLLGRHLLRQRGREPVAKAVAHFRRATEIDADFAPAWASLATGTLLMADSPISYGGLPVASALSQAQDSIAQALALDANLGEAHAAQGLAALIKFDLDAMQEPLEKAIALNPGDTQARHWLAISLAFREQSAESLALREEIVRRDPLFPVGVSEYAGALISRGRYQEAREQLALLKDLNSAFYTRQVTSLAIEEHRYADALLASRPPVQEVVLSNASKGFAMELLLVGLQEEAATILGPNDPQYLTYMGARDAATAAVQAIPPSNSPRSAADSALLLAILGEYQAAVDMYDRQVWGRISQPNHRYMPMQHLTFYAFALRQTGDMEGAEDWLDVVEERIASRQAAGDNGTEVNIRALEYWLVRGRPDRALPYLRRALPQLIYMDRLEAHPVFGPAVRGAQFKEILAVERRHRDAERAKFLVAACADDRSDLWRPLPESCAAIDATSR